MNLKKSFLFKMLSLLIIVVIVLVVYFVLKNNKKEPGVISKEESGVEKSFQENKNILDNLNNGEEILEVRGIDKNDYVQGDINAPIKIIVYNDFSSPFCLLFTDTLEKIKQEFGDKVVVAYRHFSLSKNSDSNSILAAEASECAGEQGKFWEINKELFNDNKGNKMSETQFKKDAENISLDMNKFNDCLNSGKYKEKIENQIKEAENFGVLGTPTIFVNGQILAGAYPFEDFQDSTGRDRQGMKNIIGDYLK